VAWHNHRPVTDRSVLIVCGPSRQPQPEEGDWKPRLAAPLAHFGEALSLRGELGRWTPTATGRLFGAKRGRKANYPLDPRPAELISASRPTKSGDRSRRSTELGTLPNGRNCYGEKATDVGARTLSLYQGCSDSSESVHTESAASFPLGG
jgi:hypothetical protein